MGHGEEGLLGHGNLDQVHIPTRVMKLENVGVDLVECGGYHTVALTKSG
jgi:alpha-tubulin suppressor-like RCC1 family protein